MAGPHPDLSIDSLECVIESTSEAILVRPAGEVNLATVPLLWSNLGAMRWGPFQRYRRAEGDPRDRFCRDGSVTGTYISCSSSVDNDWCERSRALWCARVLKSLGSNKRCSSSRLWPRRWRRFARQPCRCLTRDLTRRKRERLSPRYTERAMALDQDCKPRGHAAITDPGRGLPDHTPGVLGFEMSVFSGHPLALDIRVMLHL